MHRDYQDIRSRIKEPPIWFDEHGVPRYCLFSPRECADIYARECLLMTISCQSCQTAFLVAMSWSKRPRWSPDGKLWFPPALSEIIRDGELHYGDPPNISCCPAGPSMSSIPHTILEFWQQDDHHKWKRIAELERPLDCDWYSGATETEDK